MSRGSGVADLGKARQRSRNLGRRQRRLDDDQIWRRVGFVSLHRPVQPAIMRRQRYLGHAAVMDRRLHQLGGLGVFAKGLYGDARNEPCTRCDVGRGFLGGFWLFV